MREKLPEDKRPGDSLAADHVNKLSMVANRFARTSSGGYVFGRHSGSGFHIGGRRPFEQALLEITEVVSDFRYKGKIRFYSDKDEKWVTSETDNAWEIDSEDTGMGFAAEDVIIAYWDDQRGMFVPVYSRTGNWLIAQTGASGIPKRTGTTPGVGQVSLIKFDSSGDLITHKDDENNTVFRTCYNLSESALIPANTYIQMAQESLTGKHVAVWEDC